MDTTKAFAAAISLAYGLGAAWCFFLAGHALNGATLHNLVLMGDVALAAAAASLVALVVAMVVSRRVRL